MGRGVASRLFLREKRGEKEEDSMLTEAPEEDLGDTLHQRSIGLLQVTPNQENPQQALVIV